MHTLDLSDASRMLAGVVLLTIVTIEFGGMFLLRIVRGSVPMTDFQKSFARAGHAHAGVLVILSLVCLVLADATTMSGALGWTTRAAVPAAAVLMSAGFFVSSLGKDVTSPNRLVGLIWAGAACLAYGVLSLGIALLTV